MFTISLSPSLRLWLRQIWSDWIRLADCLPGTDIEKSVHVPWEEEEDEDEEKEEEEEEKEEMRKKPWKLVKNAVWYGDMKAVMGLLQI